MVGNAYRIKSGKINLLDCKYFVSISLHFIWSISGLKCCHDNKITYKQLIKQGRPQEHKNKKYKKINHWFLFISL